MDKIVAKLIADLKHEDWRVRLKSVSSLGMERTEDSVRALLSAVDDPNEMVRNEVLPALGNIGALAKEAIPFLMAKLEAKELSVRKLAVYSLGKIGPHAQVAFDKIVTLIPSAEPEFHASIAWALSIISLEIMDKLVAELENPDPSVRAAVAEAMGRAARDADLCVPALLPHLKDSDTQVRAHTAKALGNMRAAKRAEDAVPALIDTLKDEDPEVAWLASEALRKIATDQALEAWMNFEPEGSVPKLIKQLKNRDKVFRADAAKALRDLGAEARDAVDALAGAMRDQMWNVKAYSAEALARVGPDAAEAVPQLTRAIHDTDFRVKKAICLALGKIGEASAPAVPELIKLLKDPQREVRNAAAVALEEIATPEAKAVLKDYDWE